MMEEIYEVKLISKTYEIDKTILMKIPIIKMMLDDFPDNKSKILTINRSSLLFDHVIAYIIDDTYPYPLKYFTELDYYDIIYDKSKLYDPHKYTYDKLELLSKNITEINNLVVKIYNLDINIENINQNIHRYVILNQQCHHLSCKAVTGSNLFCTEHRKLFVNKCAYKDPEDNKLCGNIVDEKSKYCINHSQYGVLCNSKNCRNFRFKNTKTCFIHY